MSEATVDVADLRRADSSGAEPSAAERAGDAPLRDDIRLLGRVLGEVIGEQAGPDVLDLVESTRVEAFKIRRSEVDRAELAQRLAGLDIKSANHVIRAFSHFSLLANLAEDMHHERRRRFHRREGSPPIQEPGSSIGRDSRPASGQRSSSALRSSALSAGTTSNSDSS